jgi:hypothetical protein
MPHDSLHDLVMGEPSSQVRLGLERSDKMTGRTFFYEISLQREEGPSEVNVNVHMRIVHKEVPLILTCAHHRSQA